MPIDPGTQVGRFRIVRLIAQGGMAEVYRAEQELATGIYRPAALKVIRPEYAESEDFREMFLDEARTACTLSHPNIVHIYEVGEADGLLYMGMELVAGESLATVGKALQERGQALTGEALIAVGAYTCSALEAVHALTLAGGGAGEPVNLVHRDVSPHNLLLSPAGTLKLIDFGIAKAATNKNLTSPGVTKGKAGYFSPEQAKGLRLDGRSDLFSLGVTLYKLAAGVTPFEEHRTHQERHTALVAGRWRPLEQVARGHLPGLYAIVARAMQVRPEDRYQGAAQMREALEALAYEAGFQIGPGSLAGYVEERNGEVSISNAPRHTGAHFVRRRTGGLARFGFGLGRLGSLRGLGRRSPAGWLAAAGLALLVAAAGAVVWAVRSGPEPGAGAGAGVAAPTATPEAPPAAAAETPPSLAPTPLVPETSTVSRSGDGSEPRKRSGAGARAEVTGAGGVGRLRVGTTPMSGVVTVAGGKSLGEVPIDTKVPAGAYVLRISSPQLKKRGACSIKVQADRTVRVKYDYQSEKCSVERD